MSELEISAFVSYRIAFDAGIYSQQHPSLAVAFGKRTYAVYIKMHCEICDVDRRVTD